MEDHVMGRKQGESWFLVSLLGVCVISGQVAAKTCPQGTITYWKFERGFEGPPSRTSNIANSLESCQTACLGNPSCTAITVISGTNCFLHDTVTNTTSINPEAEFVKLSCLAGTSPAPMSSSTTTTTTISSTTTTPTTTTPAPTEASSSTTTAAPPAESTTKATTTAIPSTDTTTETTTPEDATTEVTTGGSCDGETRWYLHPNLKIANETTQIQKNVSSVDACQLECRNFDEFRCRAVTFSLGGRQCILYNTSSHVGDLSLEADDDVDLVELVCRDTENETPTRIVDVIWKSSERSFEISRVIRGVPDERQCQQFCNERRLFECRAIMFNASTGVCSITDGTLGESPAIWNTRRFQSSATAVSSSPFALKDEYIVLICMGIVALLIVAIIVGVLCLSGQKGSTNFKY